MSLNSFTILGERCSGTHFLQHAIESNFKLKYHLTSGKHFFGHTVIEDNPKMLYICLVRDPVDWIDSFFKRLHHVPDENKKNIKSFMENKWFSIHTDDNEMMEDRNMITKERYTSIFELRKVKNDYLLSLSCKNVILLRYEDLRDDYVNTLNDIHLQFKLVKKSKKYIDISFHKKEILLSLETIEYIKSKVDSDQENRLGYLIKYSVIEKSEICTDIAHKLKNYHSKNGAVNLFNGQYSYVPILKKIFNDYIKLDIAFSGFLEFEEIGKMIQYNFPVYKNQEPLFVIRIK